MVGADTQNGHGRMNGKSIRVGLSCRRYLGATLVNRRNLVDHARKVFKPHAEAGDALATIAVANPRTSILELAFKNFVGR